MRTVVQRVSRAEVRVEGEVVGKIGPGLLVLLGLGQGDTEAEADWMIQKLLQLRIFPDDDGKMNRSVTDVGGGLLVVSQFTLYGELRKGTRPSFSNAMPPAEAAVLYERFLQRLRATTTLPVAAGRFAAMMDVDLVNDGPVTIILDSPRQVAQPSRLQPAVPAPPVAQPSRLQPAVPDPLVAQPSRLQPSASVPPVAQPSRLRSDLFVPFDPHHPTESYTRELPHWRQPGCTYFITFRLADSVPDHLLRQWRLEREQWRSRHPGDWDLPAKREYHERFLDRFHHWLDAGHGACWLRQPAMAVTVDSALRHFHGTRYRLGSYVMMPNHVHALITPLGEHDLGDILHSWKSFTAHRLNEQLGRSGTVWQDESFDHIVRTAESLLQFEHYMRQNPAAAGLMETEYRCG